MPNEPKPPSGIFWKLSGPMRCSANSIRGKAHHHQHTCQDVSFLQNVQRVANELIPNRAHVNAKSLALLPQEKRQGHFRVDLKIEI
jgi:hypothetical protein